MRALGRLIFLVVCAAAVVSIIHAMSEQPMRGGDYRALDTGAAQRAQANGGSGCRRSTKAVRVRLSRSKYPNIIAHIKRSWALGYPRVLRINRIGTSTRRDKLLQGIPTKPGYDRDESPAAVLRSTVKADVAYVPSHENRSAGSSMGSQIGGWCDGMRVVYRFTP